MNMRNESTNLEISGTVESFSQSSNLSVVLTILTNFFLLFGSPLLKTVNSNLIFPSRKDNQLFITGNTFPEEMATLRNKRKLAALNKENCEEHPRSSLTQNSDVPRSQEDYITQVSEEIEGRVTKKLSLVLSFLLFIPSLGGKHNCLHAKSRYK